MAQGKTGQVVFTKSDSYGTHSLRVSWSETYTGNTSSVNVTKVEFQTSGYLGYRYDAEFAIKINGQKCINIHESDGWKVPNGNSQYNEVLKNGASLQGTAVSITHETNGTKSVNITLHRAYNESTGDPDGWDYPGFWTQYLDGGINVGYVSVPMRFTNGDSASITLTTIPMGTLSITADEHSSVEVNRTTSTYATTGVISNGASVYYGDKLKITFYAEQNYAIAKHTVNGSTFTSGSVHTVNQSGNVEVESSAQALSSVVTATNANIGSTSTVKVTRYNTSYYHSLQYSFGSSSPVTGYITSSGGTSNSEVKFQTTSISWTIPTTFYAKIPNSQTGTCTITCKTYASSSSTTQIGASTTVSITVTATGAPTISTATVTDTNTKTTALTGSSSKLVKYRSTASCRFVAAANNQSTIKSKTINGTSVGTTADTTTTYQNVSVSSFVFSVTDSRGYSTSRTVNSTMVNYIPLTLNVEASRPTPTGSTVQFSISGNFFNDSFGSVSNNVKVEYRSKLSTSSSWPSTWTTISVTKSGNSYSATYTTGSSYPYQNSYDFQIRATDGDTTSTSTALTTVTQQVSVASGVPVFDWGAEDFNFNVDVTGPVLGLGRVAKRFSSNESFNDYYLPGVYAVGTNSIARTLSDGPGTQSSRYAGTLRVWKGTGKDEAFPVTYYYVVQEYVDYHCGIWRRYGETGTTTSTITWSAWSQDYNELNPPDPPRVLQDYNGPDAYANGTRLTTADQDTGNSSMTHFLATSTMTTNKPTDGDGHIIHMGWDNSHPNYSKQLYFKNGTSAKMMVRGRDTSAWGAWKRVYTEDDIIPVANGGTGSSNGATGLKNLFAAGNTILSSYQYGTSLPANSAATAGRIFFLKVT